MSAKNHDSTEESGLSAPVGRLDLDALAMMLRERRVDGGLSIRQAAEAAEVSFMTLSRVEAGSQPDLATFLKLCAWLRVPAETFFPSGPRREQSTVDLVARHLIADPRLGRETAERIAGVVRDMYKVLAAEPESPELVACHLRAASALRPGVSDRLGGLLTDLQRRLLELDAEGVM